MSCAFCKKKTSVSNIGGFPVELMLMKTISTFWCLYIDYELSMKLRVYTDYDTLPNPRTNKNKFLSPKSTRAAQRGTNVQAEKLTTTSCLYLFCRHFYQNWKINIQMSTHILSATLHKQLFTFIHINAAKSAC